MREALECQRRAITAALAGETALALTELAGCCAALIAAVARLSERVDRLERGRS